MNLFGHADARINAALRDQLETLPHVMLAGCTHAPAIMLAERLHALTGGVLGHALWAFFKQYLLDGRFLMGRYGLVYVLLFVQYTFNKYAILYDLTHNPVQDPLRNPQPQPIEQTTPNTQCRLSLVMTVV